MGLTGLNSFLRVGDRVKVYYRALTPLKVYDGVITKKTPAGFLRIEAKDENGKIIYNELFDPATRFARGWNTLWFESHFDQEQSK